MVWFVRNTRTLNTDTGIYEDTAGEFVISEELAQGIYFGSAPAHEIRANVIERARQWNPFWFHQGLDLGTEMMAQIDAAA